MKALFLCAHMASSSHKCRGTVEEIFGRTFYKDINAMGPGLALMLLSSVISSEATPLNTDTLEVKILTHEFCKNANL